MAKYIEYNGDSMTSVGGADLGGYGIEEVRAEVAQYWGNDNDVIRITTAGINSKVMGFIFISRSKEVYAWVKPDGTARRFSPRTGRLTVPWRIPPKAKAQVVKNTKEYYVERERMAPKRKSAVRKRTVRGY